MKKGPLQNKSCCNGLFIGLSGLCGLRGALQLLFDAKITAVLTRRNALIFSENLRKIAAFPKTAAIANFRDGKVGAVQKIGSLFDSVEIQIVHRGMVGEAAEHPAEVFGIHPRQGCQILQGHPLAVMGFDVLQHRLDPIGSAATFLAVGESSAVTNPGKKTAKPCHGFQLWASLGN